MKNDITDQNDVRWSFTPNNKLKIWVLQDVICAKGKTSFLICVAHYLTSITYRIVVTFRLLQWLLNNKKNLAKPLLRHYRKMTARLNCYLEPDTQIGPGVIFPHGFPLVIHSHAILGRNCVIHPNVQIGTTRTKEGAPVIGDNCFLGNGCHIIGNCKIGDWCFISPGAFVCKDIPSGSVVGFGLNNVISNKGKETILLYLD